MVQKREDQFLVDLNNRDGVMRQWLFGAGDPMAVIIREDLAA